MVAADDGRSQGQGEHGGSSARDRGLFGAGTEEGAVAGDESPYDGEGEHGQTGGGDAEPRPLP